MNLVKQVVNEDPPDQKKDVNLRLKGSGVSLRFKLSSTTSETAAIAPKTPHRSTCGAGISPTEMKTGISTKRCVQGYLGQL